MKDFLIKNSITIIAFLVLIGLFIHGYNGYLDRKKYFDEGNTLYTVGDVIDYRYEKKSHNVYFTYIRNGVLINHISSLESAIKNSVYSYKMSNFRNMKNLVIGKKFFVKFSVEKPEYAEIYFNLPVHEEFQYEEGQTWKKPLKRAVAKEDIYGNYR